MRIARVRHRRPLYDPDWLSGSLLVTFPIFGAIGYLAAFLLYRGDGPPAPMSRLIALSPFALAAALAIRDELRQRRDRSVATALFGAPQPAPDQAAIQRERIGCVGDVVELMHLWNGVPEAPAQVNVAPYTHRVFLWMLLAWVAFGWFAVVQLGLPRMAAATVFVAILFCGVLWRLLFGVRYEVSPGRLVIVPCSRRARSERGAREVDLRTSGITCLFQCGRVEFVETDGRTAVMALDGLLNRHAFVAALFKAAGVTGKEGAQDAGLAGAA